MARITVQQAYDNHKTARDRTAAAQASMNEFNARQPELSKALADAQDAETKAQAVLLAGVQTLSPDTVAETSDGLELQVFSGTLHTQKKIAASEVTFDDGQAATQDVGTGGTTATGTPNPHVSGPTDPTTGQPAGGTSTIPGGGQVDPVTGHPVAASGNNDPGSPQTTSLTDGISSGGAAGA